MDKHTPTPRVDALVAGAGPLGCTPDNEDCLRFAVAHMDLLRLARQLEKELYETSDSLTAALLALTGHE